MLFNDPDGYKGDPQDLQLGKSLTIHATDQPKTSI